MPTDLCPDTGALRGGRAAPLTRRRARRRLHQARARRARRRRADASHWSLWGRVDEALVEHVPLDPPAFAGYVREFVPAVRDGHPLYGDLRVLLESGLQSVAYDHVRAFTNPSFRHQRRRRKGHVPTQRLRTLHAPAWERLPGRLRDLFEVARRSRWGPRGEEVVVRYRFAYPDLYRLRVRELWLTHEAVPTDAARRRQSLADRYWWRDAYYRDLHFARPAQDPWDRAYEEREAERERRRVRRDVERDLAGLPDGVVGRTRVRV